MPVPAPATISGRNRFIPHVITIRREDDGYGIRFGLTEAEDALLRGPVFKTLPEALEWVEHIEQARRG